MKPLQDDAGKLKEIMRLKRRYGAIYGATAGGAFAVASWGWNGYVLDTSHAYLPWSMLVVGFLGCAVLGGLSGWLTARFNSSLLGVLFWLVTAAGFAWLAVTLPLQINPGLAARLDPQLGRLLSYEENSNFAFRFGASLAWITPFMLLTGVTQLPITESATFATSQFGKIMPLSLCVLLMAISAIVTDGLINAHFRDAVNALDSTIQFVVEHRGQEVDPELARRLHLRALKEVEDQVQESRQLFVRHYDADLTDFDVLVKFGGQDQWIECDILYNQPVSCKAITEE
jgi:hypothetical protein